MKKLRNTLFVLSEDAYLTLDGENVVVNREKQVVARYPLHTLTTILSFSYAGASPALMGACAQREIGLSFCSPRGKFLARVANQSNGNVLLRRTQYRMADEAEKSVSAAEGAAAYRPAGDRSGRPARLGRGRSERLLSGVGRYDLKPERNLLFSDQKSPSAPGSGECDAFLCL